MKREGGREAARAGGTDREVRPPSDALLVVVVLSVAEGAGLRFFGFFAPTRGTGVRAGF